LAAGDNSDKGGDAIERAMRRRAEADASAQRIVAEAADPVRPTGQKPKTSASVPFEAPKRDRPVTTDEANSYKSAEKSFFPTSAEERAEQARRAAQRVRRRARGEDASALKPDAANTERQAAPPPPAPEAKRALPPRPAPPLPPKASAAGVKRPPAPDGASIIETAAGSAGTNTRRCEPQT